MKDINNLNIERGEIGFIVYEDLRQGLTCMKWAFETPERLADFIEKWANSEKDDK